MAATFTPLQWQMLQNLYVGRSIGFGSKRLCPTAGPRILGALSRNKKTLAGRGLIEPGRSAFVLTDAGRATVEARQLSLDLVAEAEQDRQSPYF